jgi:hypothetical protein
MSIDTGGVVYPAPIPPGVVLDKNVPITMRDGARIAVDVYKPAGVREPRPAIPVYSPFRKEHSLWDAASRYVKTPLSPAQNERAICRDSKHSSHVLSPVIPNAPEMEPVKAPLCSAVPGAARFTQ